MINIPNKQIKKFSDLLKVNYEIVKIKLNQEISVESIHYFSYIRLLKYSLIFIKDWFYIFLLITRNFFNHKSIDKNLSILLSFSEENINRLNTTKHFEDFWIKGPFQLYTKNSSFAVTNNNYSFINKKFISYKNIDLIFVLNLSQIEKLKTLFVHTLNFIKFLRTLFLNRKFLLLGKDISRLSLYESNRNKFNDINIFINANNYKHTIISFNKINKLKSYFCYYSINNTPIIYDKNINGPKLNYNKYYQYLFINYHLMLNKYHSSSLYLLGLKF